MQPQKKCLFFQSKYRVKFPFHRISLPLSSWKRVQYTITRNQGDRCRIPIPPIFTTSETFTKLICNFRRNVRLCWAVYWLQHRLRERRFSHTDDADSTDRDVIVFENHQYWLQVCYCFPLERKEKNILQNSSRPKTENSIKENWSIRKMAIKIQEPVDSESSVRGYNLIPLPTWRNSTTVK